MKDFTKANQPESNFEINTGNKLVDAILNMPAKDGLLALLEKKDNELKQHHTFDSPFRQGFLLAEDIVKKWAKENYPICPIAVCRTRE